MQQGPGSHGQSPRLYPYAVSPPTNTLAIISLVTGLASFLILPLLGAVVAVITGHLARGQIRQTGESGSGLALAGLILGYVNLLLAVILIALSIVFFITWHSLSAGSSSAAH
jgi:uncharacterized membrane protein YjfL (UPF0719 family)